MTMTLIVILLNLTIQRFVKVGFEKPHLDWFTHLFSRIDALLRVTQWWQTFWGILLLYSVIAAVYLILVSILTHFFGIIFVFLFNFLVLWYYLDAKPLALKTLNKIYLPEIFINRYYAIFAILFWYIVLGPLGVILYAETRKLCNNLKLQQEENIYFSAEFLQKLNVVRGLTDWIPVRLVGLTYALVGQFRPAFQYWYRRLSGIEAEPILIVDYGMLALNWDPGVTMSGSQDEVVEIESLMNRALFVWLVVLGIFTLGSLIP